MSGLKFGSLLVESLSNSSISTKCSSLNLDTYLKLWLLAFLLFNTTNHDQYDSPSYAEIMDVLDACIQKGYIKKHLI